MVEKTKKKMEIEEIDPNVLIIPDVRINSEFEAEILEMFKDDIAKTGINQPLVIGRDGEKLFVIDGLHRLEEAKLQGIKKVPCIVTEMSPKQMQMRNLVTNRLRGKTKASEEVKVIKDLYETHGCTIEDITEQSGMKRDRVEMLLQIGGVDEEVWRALDLEELKICQAFQISRLVERTAQLKMLQVVKTYNLNCGTLKDAVDEALRLTAKRRENDEGVETVAPPELPTAQCTVCKERYPVREISAPPLCRSCFAILVGAYNTARTEIAEETKNRQQIVDKVIGEE